jgi:hypothetical protein
MGATTFKKIDRQRYKKIYPANRKTPKMAVISDKSIIIESKTIDFTEASSVTTANYKFINTYETVPTVTYGVTSASGDMVIARITSVTITEVFIEVTAPFDGSVDIQILQVSES